MNESNVRVVKFKFNFQEVLAFVEEMPLEKKVLIKNPFFILPKQDGRFQFAPFSMLMPQGSSTEFTMGQDEVILMVAPSGFASEYVRIEQEFRTGLTLNKPSILV